MRKEMTAFKKNLLQPSTMCAKLLYRICRSILALIAAHKHITQTRHKQQRGEFKKVRGARRCIFFRQTVSTEDIWVLKILIFLQDFSSFLVLDVKFWQQKFSKNFQKFSDERPKLKRGVCPLHASVCHDANDDRRDSRSADEFRMRLAALNKSDPLTNWETWRQLIASWSKVAPRVVITGRVLVEIVSEDESFHPCSEWTNEQQQRPASLCICSAYDDDILHTLCFTAK